MMRLISWMTAAAAAAALSGCYTYPVYQPVPVARLTPEQSAAIAQQRQLTPAERDRLARDSAQVQAQDQTAAYSTPYVYAAPAAPAYYGYPAYGYPYYGGYYGGFYPWYPGVSLSLGFGGCYGRGWHGGYRHR